jgi:hypothetical protein
MAHERFYRPVQTVDGATGDDRKFGRIPGPESGRAANPYANIECASTDHMTRTGYDPGVVMGCSPRLPLISIDSMAENESRETKDCEDKKGTKDGNGGNTNPGSVTITIQVVWPHNP